MEERGKSGIVWGEGGYLLCSERNVCVCMDWMLFLSSAISDFEDRKKKVDRDLSRLDERAECLGFEGRDWGLWNI
jgi:hypothetical protein